MAGMAKCIIGLLDAAITLGFLVSVSGLPVLGVNGFDRGFLDYSSSSASAGGGDYSSESSGDILEEISWTISPRFVRNKAVGRVGKNGVEELFMEQRLDHFDRQESRTFDQRYFVNKAYWAGAESGAPVFVCVGGEGPPLTSDVLSESVHCNDMIELAPKHQPVGPVDLPGRNAATYATPKSAAAIRVTTEQAGAEIRLTEEALLLALEHRYYGESNPGDGWATESLRWQSSQQALADLADFHGYISEKEGLAGGEKWVTWGGSYPGMLAGWARLKYPHLFHAAVSSSSPLLAQLDFPQYAEIMRDSLASEDDDVGGSEACASAVETGHRVIGDMLNTVEGRQGLVTMFNLCDSSCLEDEAARVRFAGDGVVSLPIQGNDPACDEAACNIKGVCKIMTDETIGCEVMRLAALRKIQVQNIRVKRSSARVLAGSREHPEGFVFDASPSCEVFPAPDAERASSGASSLRHRESAVARGGPRASMVDDVYDPDRAWLYQTCTEFGFYQTCEVGTRCPFTQGLHTLDLDLKMCKDAFGLSPDQVREQVRLTNLFYGGDRPRGSRVIFPNGEIDPWHALGVLETPMPGLPAIYVKGASHHFWTHPSKPTDSADVVEARQIIWDQITAWLQEDE